MQCPSCNQPASSLRSALTLNGVPFSMAMQGYSKCKHCGKLLHSNGIRLSVIVSTLSAVAFVAIYVAIFSSISSWVGHTTAVGLFFPCLVIVALIITSIASTMFTKLTVVEDDKAGKGGTSA